MQLQNDMATRISFPDRTISKFSAGWDYIRFNSDGLYVDGDGLFTSDHDIDCRISGLVDAREYVDGTWNKLDGDCEGGLRDICEWTADTNHLCFAGFDEQSGMWREYTVLEYALVITVPQH